ncbi:chaplin [Streptomyces agglomeratus]|uniref:chaplin n=1 Tax=Streptomyces agglomeratus TaxID=285458 RepID=UPI0034E47479
MSSALAADGASADATTAGSPGLLSGNSIQLPVHVPVNICGNTVNVVALLNPAAGNSCANKGDAAKADRPKESGSKESGSDHSGDWTASSGASAHGHTSDSPGLISGNGIQLPVDLPVNVSGNSVNVVGVGNPAFGNKSVNGPGDQPPTSTQTTRRRSPGRRSLRPRSPRTTRRRSPGPRSLRSTSHPSPARTPRRTRRRCWPTPEGTLRLPRLPAARRSSRVRSCTAAAAPAVPADPMPHGPHQENVPVQTRAANR